MGDSEVVFHRNSAISTYYLTSYFVVTRLEIRLIVCSKPNLAVGTTELHRFRITVIGLRRFKVTKSQNSFVRGNK